MKTETIAVNLILLNLFTNRYDRPSHYVFAGMSNGEITVLKINKNDSQLITTLKGHSGSIGKY